MGIYKKAVLALSIAAAPFLVLAQKGEPVRRKAQNTVAQETPSTAIKQLQQSGADSIISFRYDTDNGVAKQAMHYVAWVKKGRGYIKTFGDYGEHLTATRNDIRLDSLFSFYTQKNIKKLPKLKSCNQSHDMGYYVSVYLSGEVSHYDIRNCQRHQLLTHDESLPGETVPYPTEDPRSVLVDIFERLNK